MEGNASTVYKNPESPQVEPEISLDQQVPGRKIFLIAGLTLAVLTLLAGVYLIINRRGATSATGESETQETAYNNPSGFEFKYPGGVGLAEEGPEVSLSGSTEMAFLVKPIEGSLQQVVDEIATNFKLNKSEPQYSQQTVNSRMGFLLLYEGKEYRYFPLYGDNYLEIVTNKDDQVGKNVLSTLKFTAPVGVN